MAERSRGYHLRLSLKAQGRKVAAFERHHLPEESRQVDGREDKILQLGEKYVAEKNDLSKETTRAEQTFNRRD